MIGSLDKVATQRYHWVVVPKFDRNGNLPPGVHDATIAEIEKLFATNAQRAMLFEGLVKVLDLLRGCNCKEVYLDGSFITDKSEPNDYDLCYEPTGINPTKAFKNFLLARDRRKERYLGDIFARMPQPPYELDHVEHWQTDQDGNIKGIIRIKLRHADDQE
jgi:hypothetical protein